MNPMRSTRFLIVCLLLLVASACTSIPVEERAQLREEINQGAGLLGGNLDITRRWSVAAEYHGFTGS